MEVKMKADNISERPWQNIFEKYFSQMIQNNATHETKTGPYISISRDFGCKANDIARKLSSELASQSSGSGGDREWKWINKEILHESARALDLSPSKIRYVFLSEKKSVMDEIIGAMSTRYYKSDMKIRNTIIEVIRTIARSGHVIIVGRGGVAFAGDNPQSLHVKLIAPMDWRIARISKNYGKTREEALQYIRKIDRERKHLIDSFVGHETDHSIFDMILNRKTMSEKCIVDSIIHAARDRSLI